ncbi:MAG: GDP-mannose 4,6-dehydratase [Bacteroidetes bacterium]|nr:GDP-mannose 4,6-dehydratase [Bacteroidota bacterium]
MNHFIITGFAGFIGSHTTELLLSKGHKITGIDNFDPFYSREIKEKNISSFVNHKNFSLLELDITDKSIYKHFPQGIDCIIHLAAKAGVRPSIEDPRSYVKTNITGTQNILEWASENNVKKMIFASSSSVYGNNEKLPFSEDDDVNNPISPYAFTKRSCELLNYLWHKLHGIDIINLRFFTVYGPKQRPDLAIRKFAELIKVGKPIQIFGDGKSARDYTYIDDILQGILASIEYIRMNNGVFEIINLGNSNPVQLQELIDLIYKLSGKPKNVVQSEMQPGDVDYTCADIRKAQRLLNFEPKTNFQEGLGKFLQWLDKN